MKRIYTLFLTFCLLLMSLCGCNREKPTAIDSVKAIYDLYILGDSTGAVELGMTQEEIDEALTAYDKALAETIRTNFSTSGLEIEEETITSICQARKKLLHV